MLVQVREDGLRLIRQHDHALLAGRLAAAWKRPPVGPVPWPTVLATSLHDVMWSREDRTPSLDPSTGRPHDFTSCPTERKEAMVRRGLRLLEALSPELARPVAAHHRALASGTPGGSDPELTRIRFFDLLSLQICLLAPPAAEAPAWLRGDPREVEPEDYRLPDLRWRAPDTVQLSPFPFPRPMELSVPARDLPPGPYPEQADLDRAWGAAAERPWRVRFTPPATPG